MGPVAIAAGNAGCEHFALLKRAVVVDLIEHLPVGLIKAPANRRNGVCLRQPLTREPAFRKLTTTRMTQTARLRLFAQAKGQLAARRIATSLINRPVNVATLVEANRKPLHRIFSLTKWPPTRPPIGPADVLGARAMARLTADADLGEACGEAIGRRVVVLAHAGRMAFRTHVVPILVQLGPVQKVVVTDLFVGVEVEPALTTLFPGTAVPGNR